MARVAGVDIPDGKRVDISIRSIYGIGPAISEEIMDKLGLDDGNRPDSGNCPKSSWTVSEKSSTESTRSRQTCGAK